MPKQIVKNVAQQIGQLTGEIGEEIKKQPQEMAGKILEQMGMSASNPQTNQPTAQADEVAKVKLEQMKARETSQSQQAASQISRQLEQEIDQRRKMREEQLRQRREAPTVPVPPQEAPVAPTSKPSRRFGLWGRRIKSAQDQAQPETVGRRVGG